MTTLPVVPIKCLRDTYVTVSGRRRLTSQSYVFAHHRKQFKTDVRHHSSILASVVPMQNATG